MLQQSLGTVGVVQVLARCSLVSASLIIMADATDNPQHVFKIVLVGDTGVGKSALLQRFTSDRYAAIVLNGVHKKHCLHLKSLPKLPQRTEILSYILFHAFIHSLSP